MEAFNYLYEDDYVAFDIEFTDYGNFFHCEVLKKDEHTRRHINKVWIHLQEYMLARGEDTLFAMIDQEDETLKTFASYYNFKKCDKKEDSSGNEYEIWKVELR